MNFNEARELLWLAGGLYGLAFFVGFFKPLKTVSLPLSEIPLFSIILGFLFHTRALFLRGLDVHGCPLGNTLERIQFILWSLILTYLILRILWRLNLLGTFCAGLSMCAGWFALSVESFDPSYWVAANYQRLFSDPWIELHASIAIFSYGIFSLLAVVSCMYLIQRQALLSRKSNQLGSFLPPIHNLEHASYRLLSIGFFFLTLSLVVGGMHWLKQPEFVTTNKLIITLALWLGYTLLFFLRMGNKLFGSKFAKLCIALFFIAILSLSFVSSKTENTKASLLPAENSAYRKT